MWWACRRRTRLQPGKRHRSPSTVPRSSRSARLGSRCRRPASWREESASVKGRNDEGSPWPPRVALVLIRVTKDGGRNAPSAVRPQPLTGSMCTASGERYLRATSGCSPALRSRVWLAMAVCAGASAASPGPVSAETPPVWRARSSLAQCAGQQTRSGPGPHDGRSPPAGRAVPPPAASRPAQHGGRNSLTGSTGQDSTTGDPSKKDRPSMEPWCVPAPRPGWCAGTGPRSPCLPCRRRHHRAWPRPSPACRR